VKNLFLFLTVFVLGLCIAFGGRAIRTAAAAPASPQGRVMGCDSNDMRRHICATDTRGGVQMIRQKSDAPCVQGKTWGFDGGGIWVDRGCRADFQIGGGGGGGFNGGGTWGGWDRGYNIYCPSDDGRKNWCPTDTRGGVQMVRQRSGSPCVLGSTWGFDQRGIWVDRGCRADFQIGGKGGWNPGGGGMTTLNCSSNDMRRNVCPVNTRGRVRLIRQRSDADCIYNQTWGYNNNSIWVDRGCRADFEVGGR
jgi:hypothetical protein